MKPIIVYFIFANSILCQIGQSTTSPSFNLEPKDGCINPAGQGVPGEVYVFSAKLEVSEEEYEKVGIDFQTKIELAFDQDTDFSETMITYFPWSSPNFEVFSVVEPWSTSSLKTVKQGLNALRDTFVAGVRIRYQKTLRIYVSEEVVVIDEKIQSFKETEEPASYGSYIEHCTDFLAMQESMLQSDIKPTLFLVKSKLSDTDYSRFLKTLPTAERVFVRQDLRWALEGGELTGNFSPVAWRDCTEVSCTPTENLMCRN